MQNLECIHEMFTLYVDEDVPESAYAHIFFCVRIWVADCTKMADYTNV